jgi:hypothetical protein
MLMMQTFSLTWIDILIVLVVFAAVLVRFFVDSSKLHKVFKILLHPITLMSSFVLVVIFFSRF